MNISTIVSYQEINYKYWKYIHIQIKSLYFVFQTAVQLIEVVRVEKWTQVIFDLAGSIPFLNCCKK